MASSDSDSQLKIVHGDAGYILEDVPHFTDYILNLPTYPNPLRSNPAYSVVKQYFVHMDDTVPQKVVVHKDSPRGVHFRRAGPRQKVYFKSDDVHACIVTCGGLCPGLNTVIREIVCGLSYMYGVNKVLGIDGGYRGFYSKNTINLTPKVVNDIHKRGGTILGTSRGGHDTGKIVDSIQDRGINQVYIIGGDGTQRGAAVIYEEVRRRGLKVAIAGIPKTIDNDIPVIDKSFGFDTAVEEAQRAINAAHVESECENLKTLRVQSCKVIDGSPGLEEHLGCCEALERLHLQKSQLRDKSGVGALFSVCRNAREIVLQDCWGLDNSTLSLAIVCRRVKLFYVEGCSLLTTEGLESVIEHWKELECLRVESCKNIKDSDISPELATLFSTLKELKWRPDTKYLYPSDMGIGMGKKGGKFFKRT